MSTYRRIRRSISSYLKNLSFFVDDFREFVDSLVVALREMEKSESPAAHVHPIIVRENRLAAVEADD
ncbi:MAG: hypothetical protein L6433_12945 [Actinomycetia bacterium]|nr:hypothetical protein [Actinomycetes bacterium]